eukprot:253238-Hanusia_phi.AAC.4
MVFHKAIPYLQPCFLRPLRAGGAGAGAGASLCMRKRNFHVWRSLEHDRQRPGQLLMSARPEEVSIFAMMLQTSLCLISTRKQAGPAADLLFDVFQFVFSPAGFASLGGVVGDEEFARGRDLKFDTVLAFLWDVITASDGRNLLGQKEATSISLLGQEYNIKDIDKESRFILQFSATNDGFYESPNGLSAMIVKVKRD